MFILSTFVMFFALDLRIENRYVFMLKFIALILMFTLPAFSDDLPSQDANKDTRDADTKLNTFTGDTRTTQEIYELSADIFPTFVKEANGDPEKIQELLKKASENPESVSSKLTDDQKKKLSEIADKMPRAPAQN